jgi:ParB family chromosome partitioning protein
VTTDAEHATTDAEQHTQAWAGARLWLLDPRVLILDRNPRAIGNIETERAELVDSVREHGVLQPILTDAEPDPSDPDGIGELHVRDGHCRTLAAIVTGKNEIPVIVAAHADAESYELRRDQYLGNQCRKGLNPAEQADLLHELALFGLSAEQIAAQLSTSTETVASGLAVHRSQAARETLVEYPQLSLTQAGAVAEMTEAGDDEAIAELEEVITEDPSQVDHAIARWRHDQAAQAAVTEAAAELEASGVIVFASSQEARKAEAMPLYRLSASSHDHTRLSDDPEAHTSCPGRAAVITARWDGQVHTDHWCATPGEAGHADLWAGPDGYSRPQAGAQKTEHDKAEMRRVRVRNSEWRAAQDVRRDFVKTLLGRKQPPKQAGQFLAGVLTAGDYELIKALERRDCTLAGELAGFEHTPGRDSPLAAGLSRGLSGHRHVAVPGGGARRVRAGHGRARLAQPHTGRETLPDPAADVGLCALSHVENLALGEPEDTTEWPHLRTDKPDGQHDEVGEVEDGTEQTGTDVGEDGECDVPAVVTDELDPDDERGIVDIYLPNDAPDDPDAEDSTDLDAAEPGAAVEDEFDDGSYADAEELNASGAGSVKANT